MPLSSPLRPRTGLTLLVAGPSVELAPVVQALKSRGLRPALAPIAESVTEIASKWPPRVTVIWAGADGWKRLLRFLDQREVPVVLIGSEQQLRSCAENSAIQLVLFAPAAGPEIADAVEALVGPASNDGVPSLIELDRVQIDVLARRATVEGEILDLPPKLFDMLMVLALQPGHPINSRELLRRLWPGSPRATTDDVNWHASQLRKLIGDHNRVLPLIENRRGFGYVLNDFSTG